MQERDNAAAASARPTGSASLLHAFYGTKSKNRLKDTIGDLRFFARFCGVNDEDAVAELLFGPAATEERSNQLVRDYLERMNGDGLAPGTINRRLSVLRSLARVARLSGVIRWSIAVQGQKPRDTRGVSRPALERAEALAHKSDPTSRRDRAITLLTHELKLTRAEVVALDLEQYDPDPRTPSIISGSSTMRISIKTKRALDGWVEERGFKAGALFVQIGAQGPDASARLAPDDVLHLVRANPQIDYDA